MKLSRRMERGLLSLMTAPTTTEAAKLAGCGESTLRRYLQNETFQAEYRAARRMLTSNALARLQSQTEKAANVVIGLLAENPAVLHLTACRVRLQAARLILELAIRGIEHEDMERRIQTLETALQRMQAA